MTILILVRHGEAEPKRPGMSDWERRLTRKGAKGVEAVARLLTPSPELVLHSPLLRARDTAEIIARLHGAKLAEEPRLAPDDFGPESLAEILEGAAQGAEIAALVGHNPSMRDTIEYLVGGRIQVPPGTAAVVELEAAKVIPGGGILRLLLTPEAAERCS